MTLQRSNLSAPPLPPGLSQKFQSRLHLRTVSYILAVEPHEYRLSNEAAARGETGLHSLIDLLQQCWRDPYVDPVRAFIPHVLRSFSCIDLVVRVCPLCRHCLHSPTPTT